MFRRSSLSSYTGLTGVRPASLGALRSRTSSDCRPEGCRSSRSRWAGRPRTSRPVRGRRSGACRPPVARGSSPLAHKDRVDSPSAITGHPDRRLGVLRLQHERRCHLHEEGLTVFEPGVVPVIEADNLRVLQPRDTVAVVPFAPELEAVKHVLAQRERIGVIGVQVGVDVPLRGLLLASALRLVHDRLVGKCRVPALRAAVVRVQRVSRAAVEKPPIGRVPHQEQVVVGFDVRQAAPEVRSDAALRVLFGERPELAGGEHPVEHFPVVGFISARKRVGFCLGTAVSISCDSSPETYWFLTLDIMTLYNDA